ncbi:Fe-S oxidoreductase [Thermosipho africanus H17ap60334]|uniref:Fe-S oxidoreductase n=1 Tax=Thermosipho africanus (strain TCF52B) TaxID=484019 RepID=B7IH09_THEAB|nr:MULTISPECIES: tRNA (N(6)-L-threonylcarbamoyladenosine(37)-C(2))-methylthiotransferase MtaB [Thermosipho]HCF38127.1 tRNA (N(6)-L-threonylcarbamoyladenosine(37)-C(2))-methylthiotransferase MtaB [Thermosipho africanus]ACJ75373.1 Fe-S oxidoreductase [Thermosipho africanus TCF52B]EKF50148.1 Fe-S oxidoreductase [Thermosipho africanus H17ap60334]MBZ4651027.1 Fe-S oxidoreductase [Thermosipho sp. (in: thermotogales)]MDK2840047.1 threonylcarbamoyladenosine tRNA methylthiotransferase MtaB [Thermosipho
MRVSVLTYGCKLNQYESELMAEKLENEGYIVVNEEVESDVFVINSCVVTNEATRKIKQQIRRLKRKFPGAKVVVTGCYSQLGFEELEKEGVDLVLGNNEKKYIDRYLGESGIFVDKAYWNRNSLEDEFVFSSLAERTRAFIKVQDGCTNTCSYCAIRFARGNKIRSKPVDLVVSEVLRLVNKDYKEIVITGLNLGKFGKDIDSSLHELLRSLVKIKGDFRIRLSSINPEDLDEELISLIGAEEKICNHLHIPLQSGSTDVLKNMRRNYTQDDYLRVVDSIRKVDPNFSITTDIMVGFPGESEKDFEETLKVVREVLFSKVHAFRYSDRPNTLASKMPKKVPGNVKKERVEVLEKLSAAVAKDYRKRLVGRKAKVLIESYKNKIYSGYDEYYVLHETSHGEFGKIENVTIQAVTDEGVISKKYERKVSNR